MKCGLESEIETYLSRIRLEIEGRFTTITVGSISTRATRCQDGSPLAETKAAMLMLSSRASEAILVGENVIPCPSH
jgi:hypothetical protein